MTEEQWMDKWDESLYIDADQQDYIAEQAEEEEQFAMEDDNDYDDEEQYYDAADIGSYHG